MARLKALAVTFVGTVAIAGCTVTVNKGPTEPEPAPPPPPPPAQTAAPAPAPTQPPAAKPAPKPEKKYKVDKDGRIHIPGNIVFELDSAKIKQDDPGTQDVLNQLKKFIEENKRVSKVRIEGHTDNQGDDAHNDKLSVDRALAVKSWLVSQGIASERIIAVGFGEKRPLADNSTEDGRAQNRRTEFHIAEIEGTPYLGKPVNGPAGGIVAE
jgi:OOP family OmpA-OmpF porin